MRDWLGIGALALVFLGMPAAVGLYAWRQPARHYRVEMVSEGRVVRSWVADTPPRDNGSAVVPGDVWSFREAGSGRWVRIRGQLIITEAD